MFTNIHHRPMSALRGYSLNVPSQCCALGSILVPLCTVCYPHGVESATKRSLEPFTLVVVLSRKWLEVALEDIEKAGF